MMMSSKEKIDVVAALITDESGRILITRRPPGGHLAGYWEFPGGKIRRGESPEHALVRELLEEIGIETQVQQQLWQQRFEYPERIIDISFYRCLCLSPLESIRAIEVDDFRWVHVHEFSAYTFPPADSAFIERIPQLLGED